MSKSEAGKLGWKALVRNKFDNDELAAKTWLAQLGRYAYGLNYRRRGADMFWYPTWVKACFRTHPGRPHEFMTFWRNSAANDVEFYQGEPF